ncbi:MAG: TonB-dependent receptor [Lacibacter sp.]
MKIVLSTIICFLSLQLSAQMPGGAGGGRNSGAQMNMGRLYGKILDSKTGKPIDAASVQLIQNKFDSTTKTRKDVIVNGQLTVANGDFSLENLNIMVQYKLKITAIGYKTIEQKVAFSVNMSGGGDMSSMLNSIDKDLGNIKLETDVKELGEVVVTGDKPMLQLGIDRKIFNVEKNIVSQGGTGVDIMRNVPTVTVDIDGNITLRNSAPQIFVDGRPTTLTLDQIPADAISSVELITNPSAKFDASGGQSAIINIVLKKNRRVGYSGGIRVGVDMRGKLTGGGDINVRQGKINFFANIGVNQRKTISFGETNRTNLLDTYDNTFFTRNRNTSDGLFGFGRAGFDFLIDNRNTITLSGSIMRGNFNGLDENTFHYDTLEPTFKQTTEDRYTNSKFEMRNSGGQISYKHNFPKAGKEWTADVNYNSSHNVNDQNIFYTSFDANGTQLAPTFNQGIDGGGESKLLVTQTDYSDPISENIKIEGGLRSQVRWFQSFQKNSLNGVFNPLASNEFTYVDYVNAAYASYSQKIKKANLNFQIGLRIENSKYDGQEVGKPTGYSNQFPFALFPSAFLSKSFKGKQDMQLNYSRRINRPNFFQLLPNTDRSDITNFQTGNPGLVPEFTNSLELTYQKTYGEKNNTFLATLFGKQTNNFISRYQGKVLLPDFADSVLASTYINATRSYAVGLELVFRNTVTKWWEINYNANIYYSKIEGSVLLPDLANERTSYFIKLNNSFKFGKGWSMQLSGDYNSKSILPASGGRNSGGGRGGMGGFGGGGMGGGQISTTQGYIADNYYVDFGIRKEFKIKNNTATVSANWSDVFSTRQNKVISESSFFYQDSWRRRDPAMVRVNFSYRFGKFDASLFKRKNNRTESGDDMQMQ